VLPRLFGRQLLWTTAMLRNRAARREGRKVRKRAEANSVIVMRSSAIVKKRRETHCLEHPIWWRHPPGAHR
jgi:hypothetical protein